MRRRGFARIPLWAVAAAAAGAALLAVRGGGWPLWTGWALAAAAALSGGRDPWCLSAVVPLLLPPAGVGGPAGSAAVVLSAAMVAASRSGLAARGTALAGGLLAFMGGRAAGMELYLAFLAVAAVLPSAGSRRAALLAGMAVVPLFGRLPLPSSPETRIVGERYGADRTVWDGPYSIHAGGGELLLRVGEPGRVLLDLGAGGVRDDRPVGLVVTDMMALPVRPGRDTLEVRQSSGWVMVTMERQHAPRTHPVVHLYGAWTGEGQ